MNKKLTVDALAVRICRTIRDMCRDDRTWINLDQLHQRVGLDNLRALDAAVAFAAAKGWLLIGGRPVQSVLLSQTAP